MLKKLDSYLFREFAQATFATLVALMIVSLGGVFADVLGDIARARVPAGMMLAQLGLHLLNYLPQILPLGLMLGLLLALGRLYRHSELPVLPAIGVRPRRLLPPMLMLVSLGGVFADVLGDIARGRVPAGMMLAQLGLQLLNYLPLILPLGLMLGLLLASGRLYRDSEMPVLTAIGVGPRRLLRPLMMLVLPVVAVIALCSLWLGPWARDYARGMVEAGNRSLLVAGLEPGRFIELPGGGGVVYVGSMSNDGTRLSRVFVYRKDGDRLDVTTARHGELNVDGDERYLTLSQGFEVEGPLGNGRDYRLMRYASNDLRLPDVDAESDDTDPERMPTSALLGEPRPEATAQLQRSEAHTSELQSPMRISYSGFCLK